MQNKPRRTYGHIPKKSVSEKTPHFEKKIIKKSREKKQTTPKLVMLFGKLVTILFSLIRHILHAIVQITKLLIPKKHSFGSLIKIGITVGILGVIGLSSIVVFVSKDLPDPDKLTDRIVAQSTKIYDKTGEHLLYEIFSEQKRTLVALEDIPEELKNGVIATEDAAFYEHKGIRPLSILRSLVYGVLGKSRLGGGASTLTQQLV